MEAGVGVGGTFVAVGRGVDVGRGVCDATTVTVDVGACVGVG